MLSMNDSSQEAIDFLRDELFGAVVISVRSVPNEDCEGAAEATIFEYVPLCDRDFGAKRFGPFVFNRRRSQIREVRGTQEDIKAFLRRAKAALEERDYSVFVGNPDEGSENVCCIVRNVGLVAFKKSDIALGRITIEAKTFGKCENADFCVVASPFCRFKGKRKGKDSQETLYIYIQASMAFAKAVLGSMEEYAAKPICDKFRKEIGQ